MHNEHFYHSSTRAYIVAFGNVFNELTVTHGNMRNKKVPIKYASKEKFIETLLYGNDVPGVEKSIPVMSYEMTAMSYDSARKTNTLHKSYKQQLDETYSSILNPVPYNFDFTLSCWARYGDELLQMIEQILPFFQPSFNITIKEIPEMGITERDIPILLNGVGITNEYQGDRETRRVLQWELNFTLKGWLYPPIKNNATIIKKVDIDFGVITSTGNQIIEGLEFLVDPFNADPVAGFDIIQSYTFFDEFDAPDNSELNPQWGSDETNPRPLIINNKVCSRDSNINTTYYDGIIGLNSFIEGEISLVLSASPVVAQTLQVRVDRTTLEGYYLNLFTDGSIELIYQSPTAVQTSLATLPAGTLDEEEDQAKLSVTGTDETDIELKIYVDNIELLSTGVTAAEVSSGTSTGFSVIEGCYDSIRVGTKGPTKVIETPSGFTNGFSEGYR